MSTVDLGRYLSILWKWAWLLILASGLAALVSFLFVRSLPPVYLSSATLAVGDPARALKPGDEGFSVAQQVAESFTSMAQRQPVLEATVDALDLPFAWEDLRKSLVVIHPTGSLTFELRVTNTDPERARNIVATITQILVDASPTAANLRSLQERREFIKSELDVLQAKIQSAKEELERKQSALSRETSARGVLERQDEIRALDLNLTTWRSSYSALLTAYDAKTVPNNLIVLEPASISDEPAGPNKWWNVAFAALAGLLLAACGVLLIEYLDDTIRTKESLEEIVGTTSLGAVARMAELQAADRPLVLTEPGSLGAEAFRLLAVNLRFTGLGRSSELLLVTSATQGEGKSTIVANVAAALAQAGKRILLVDLDLRNPSIHVAFGTSNDVGTTTLLLNPALRLTECVVQSQIPGLFILPSGPIPPNPSELLARFGEQFLGRLRGVADFVLIDCPPVLAVADTAILAGLVDGTLLVCRTGRTRRGDLESAAEALARTQARIVGVVLNAASGNLSAPYGYLYPARKARRNERWPWQRTSERSKEAPAS
jgi:polysaccharide biosynthesis transport protein